MNKPHPYTTLQTTLTAIGVIVLLGAMLFCAAMEWMP